MSQFALRTPHLYVVRSEFSPSGPEAEWNRWYDEVDVPEMLAVPGVLSATRYRELHDEHRYLTLWEIEGPEVLTTPAYRQVAGWREWMPHVVDSSRLVLRVVEDLGRVGA